MTDIRRSRNGRGPMVLSAIPWAFALALAGCAGGTPPEGGFADLLLTGGEVWTGLEGAPLAQAVAIRGNLIVGVGSVAEVAAFQGPDTRTVDLEGRFVSPGFIDNHTHFARAGELLLGANLLDVSDAEGMSMRVREAVERMPAGSWLVGGMWGAYEAWEQGSSGQGGSATMAEPFDPDRALVDALTPDHPVLFSKWDRSAYLANGNALDLAGVTCDSAGVECSGGEATGRLTPEAAQRVQNAIPEKPLEQKLAESNAALQRLREHGVTTVHDITSQDQWEVYQELKRRGELTTRIYARPTLDRWEELVEAGQLPGFGDEWVKIGGLKGFVDGIMGNSSARFYEPYLTSGELGIWRTMVQEEPGMEALLLGADAAGFWPQVHAIGDMAIDTLLDMFERVMEANGPKDRRFRMIHTQVMRGPAVAARMAKLGIIAEVQPYHTIDDMRWMEERIGERSRWAYAFRTLQDAGVMLSFGSDWPGTNAAWYTSNPMMGMYAAVTRQTLEGEPADGWFPEERVDVETALRAYTVNNAFAAGEEEIKGSIGEGMLADLVVLDSNPLTVDPSSLKDVLALMTIVDGAVVFERQ